MSKTPPQRLHLRGLSIVIGLILLLLQPQAASAQHRAKLSRGLEVQLSGSASLNVLVQGPQAEIDRLAASYGVRVVKRLEMGAVLSGTGAQIGAVAGDANVGALAADSVVVSTMAITTQATGANQLWASRGGSGNFGGLTGAGVGIAVIDSGIAQHPDVDSRVRLRVDFVNDNSGTPDGYGHGTHVAGIIAGGGRGSRSAEGTSYVGMAPGAELVSLRVLGADGTGYVSDVILAIEWAIRNKARYKLRVLNLSLGHEATEAYQFDPMAQAVERAVAAGLVVVASAGNLGKAKDGTPLVGAVVSPGDTPGALTVGALNTHGTVVRSDDTVATYSSRGPVGDPDDPSTWEVKPDLVAPGNAIVAAGSPGTYLWDTLPERRVFGDAGGTYLTLSGSSMSTAVVSGAVAQLLQAQPSLTPAQAKFVLQFTAEHLDGVGLIEQGAGSLNVPLAVALAQSDDLASAPSSVQIGGAMAEAGGIAFSSRTRSSVIEPGDVTWGNTIIWGHSSASAESNTIIWGHRSASVDPNTIIWGHQSGTVDPNTIIWGHRSASVDPNTIIWGHQSGTVDPNTIIWGHRSASVDPNTIIWGHQSGTVDPNTIIWGHQSASVDPNTIIWGHQSGTVDPNTIIWGHQSASVDPNTIIWGHQSGTVDPNTIIWGHQSASVDPNTIIWGHRSGTVDPNTIIWGHQSASVDPNTIIWGHQSGTVDPNTIIWGHQSASVDPNTIIWGHRSGTVDPNTIIWGHQSASVDPNTIIWGHRSGTVDPNTIIWGHRSASVDPNTIIWGHQSGTVDPNTIIWGHRSASVDPNTIIWGHQSGTVDPNTIIWGHRSASVDPNTIIWGHQSGTVDPNTIIWGHRSASVDPNTIIWGHQSGTVDPNTIIWGHRSASVDPNTIIWGHQGGTVDPNTIIWGH